MTSRLLAETTGPSEADSPDDVTPEAQQAPSSLPAYTASPSMAGAVKQTPAKQTPTKLVPFSGAQESPADRFRQLGQADGLEGGMLEDETMDGLEVPPDPSPGWQEQYRAAETPALESPNPTPSMFPGTKSCPSKVTFKMRLFRGIQTSWDNILYSQYPPVASP